MSLRRRSSSVRLVGLAVGMWGGAALAVAAEGAATVPLSRPRPPAVTVIELPALEGHYVGTCRTPGAATNASSTTRKLGSAKVRLQGHAVVGRRTCAEAGPDTLPSPLTIVVALIGAPDGPMWTQGLTLSADGPFDTTADFTAGLDAPALSVLGAALDTVKVVGGTVRKSGCTESAVAPQLTIDRAELVVEWKDGDGVGR